MKESPKTSASPKVIEVTVGQTVTGAASARKPVPMEKPAEGSKLSIREKFGNALGFIETRGYIPAVEAADAMLKAANIKPILYRKLGFGLIVIGVAGEISAVRTAIESGVAAAQRTGISEIKSCVIANPSPGLTIFLPAGLS